VCISQFSIFHYELFPLYVKSQLVFLTSYYQTKIILMDDWWRLYYRISSKRILSYGGSLETSNMFGFGYCHINSYLMDVTN
jgi:hypothetical protein